jgi:Cys-tRNA(Pro)/Cys-tRNA(Cys) deacylase
MAGARTPATKALDAAGVRYTAHPYTAPGQDGYGTEAADALGVPPARVLKTLVAEVDGTPVLAMVPVAGTLDLKALAAARGAKRATMADPATAQRLTGYVVGGIAPLGTRRALPVLVDRSALDFPTVHCSAGRRGLQLELTPADLVAAADATVADLAGG